MVRREQPLQDVADHGAGEDQAGDDDGAASGAHEAPSGLRPRAKLAQAPATGQPRRGPARTPLSTDSGGARGSWLFESEDLERLGLAAQRKRRDSAGAAAAGRR